MEQTLRNALVKATRALESESGVDPLSGFSLAEILDWVEEHTPLDPVEGDAWERAFRAFLRRSVGQGYTRPELLEALERLEGRDES
jgi:hypothetical protein